MMVRYDIMMVRYENGIYDIEIIPLWSHDVPWWAHMTVKYQEDIHCVIGVTVGLFSDMSWTESSKGPH